MRHLTRILALFCLIPAALPGAQRLPDHLPPEIYAWFWQQETFAPGGATAFLDMVANRTNYNFLTTSIRLPAQESVLATTHDRIREAVLAAHQRGLRVALDLDPRLARTAFQKAHPGELQWMLMIRTYPWPAAATEPFTIQSIRMDDHMTWPGTEYDRLTGRLVRAWRIRNGQPARIVANPVEQTPQQVRVTVAAADGRPGDTLAIAVAFEYRTPDVFAPSLDAFQESIFALYKDVPLDGAMKDEWGFPPTRGRGGKDGNFWYSPALTAAWTRAGGAEFIDDALLMHSGAGGTGERRLAAINRLMRLTLERNVAIEQHFYRTAKSTFGPGSFVGTHATWGIWPEGDIFKNGCDWWQATRDYGQTDEGWPMPIRTALAKKMGKPVWYNQYYNQDPEPYLNEIWTNAAHGGRVNVHPLYPGDVSVKGQHDFLTSPIMRRALNRVRLLNYFAEAPIDSPIAVVFGHPAALNWISPHFTDFGIEIADELTRAGYRADVIPSTEIANGSLRIENRQVRYGKQSYRALIFLNPDFEPDSTLAFLRQAAASGTRTFLRGQRRHTFEGAAIDTPTPEGVLEFHGAQQVVSALNGAYREHVEPASLSRLTDGSCVLVSPTGGALKESFYCNGNRIEVQATGVFAIRMNRRKQMERLAASDLESLTINGTRYSFPRPVDVAIWRDANGEWQGVVQGGDPPPAPIGDWVRQWQRLDAAPPQAN